MNRTCSAVVSVLVLLTGTSVSVSLAGPTNGAPAIQPAAATALDGPSAADTLIGKTPPPIVVAKWVKGEPVASFEKGKVYVVDFWATWCGPCKAAIPHLSQLAKEHKGQLEVLGVAISERQSGPSDTSYIDGVGKFVQRMGDKMDYRVAVDTPEKTMHATWFKPSGMEGIPTAYVIDKEGKIAWIGIGDPKDVERVVGQVLAGTFDAKKEIEERRKAEQADAEKAKEQREAAKVRRDEMKKKYPGYFEAMDRGDRPAALAALEKAFKNDPTLEPGGAYQWKLNILMSSEDRKPVEEYGRDLLKRYPDNGDVIGFFSAVAVEIGDQPRRIDPALQLEAAQKAHDLAKAETRWALYTKWRLGWALYNAGQKEKAAQVMQAAIDGVIASKGKFELGDLEDQCRDALKTFKDASK